MPRPEFRPRKGVMRMRKTSWIGLALFAFALAAPATAPAQVTYEGEGGCTKGLFWPFVRDPGDCLTDNERASGRTGTYRQDEIVREPQASAPASVQASQTAAPAPAATPASTEPSAVTPAQSAASPAVQPQAEPAADQAAGVVPASEERTEYLGEGGCTKGLLWPFVRRAGDCLTDAERQSGRSGTYRE